MKRREPSWDAASAAALLEQGLRDMAVHLPAAAPEQLLAYLQLLERWGRRFSLTAARTPAQMVHNLLLDSLSLMPCLPAGESLLDAGSGAGLPGVPLAIACPQLQVVLLERSANKARFLRQVKAELGLERVQVAETEVERYRPEKLPDIITARAVKPPALLLPMLAHLCRPGTRLLLPRGRSPRQGLEPPPPGIVVECFKVLQVPGVAAKRHLAVCRCIG